MSPASEDILAPNVEFEERNSTTHDTEQPHDHPQHRLQRTAPRDQSGDNLHVSIERIVPDLSVTDLRRTVDEYVAALGLEVVMDHGWIVTLADAEGRQLNLLTADATAPENPTVSVFVDDVQAAYERVSAVGLEIVHPLTIEKWGVARFFYRDTSGNVINVGMHDR